VAPGEPPTVRPWGGITFEQATAWDKVNRPAFADVNELLLGAVDLAPGQRVLDLACGLGTPALDEARRVAPGGGVIGIDLSGASVALARRYAEVERVPNVDFREADAESLPFADGSFDRVSSRFGPMFFPHLHLALREALRVLRPGGRLAWMVWGRFQDQPFFQATAGSILEVTRATTLPPETAQPFRFGEGGLLSTALRQAGFVEVAERRHVVATDWPATPENLVDHWWGSMAPPFQPLASGLDPALRDRARALAVTRLREAYSGGAVRLRVSVLLATGVKPGG
jgi:SAM-dependent methyltransferase